ncbi:hypothetical protein GOP47_0013840 [Adiantum capillus-veneris]|uniref:SHSP domain-containing protein n=1 Tax=Adiantum capillus-veneris TaxID=13818 RepID=A0A9D4ZDS1_ADICA|nr:hypothetical protein GOP47_0013840 [Adiantum capillus-veneris]
MAMYSFFVPIASIGELNVDWFEDNEGHVLQVDIPGLTKEDLSLQVLAQNILQIVGVHTGSVATHEAVVHVLERPRGAFLRQYRLPDNVLEEEVKAYDENGVLTITIPKLKVPYVCSIPIYVSQL